MYPQFLTWQMLPSGGGVGGGSYFAKRFEIFSWWSFLPQSLLAISASCLLIGGPVVSSSRKVAVNSFKNSSLSSAPSRLSCTCSVRAPLPPTPIFTIEQKLYFILRGGNAYRVLNLVGFHGRVLIFFIRRETFAVVPFAVRFVLAR